MRTVTAPAAGSSRPAAPPAASQPQTPTPTDHSAAGVRAVGRQFVDDFASRSFGDACGLLTPAGQAQVGKGSASRCPGRLLLARSLITPQRLVLLRRQFETLRPTVSGDHATAQVAPGAPGGRFAYVNGRWLIDASPGG